MTIAAAIAAARYVVNANGEKTDVLLPVSAWETLLASGKNLTELLEDQEDGAILKEWLERRTAGLKSISLDDLERELTDDDSLPG